MDSFEYVVGPVVRSNLLFYENESIPTSSTFYSGVEKDQSIHGFLRPRGIPGLTGPDPSVLTAEHERSGSMHLHLDDGWYMICLDGFTFFISFFMESFFSFLFSSLLFTSFLSFFDIYIDIYPGI